MERPGPALKMEVINKIKKKLLKVLSFFNHCANIIKVGYHLIGFEMKLKYFLQLIILFFGFFMLTPVAKAETFTVAEAQEWAQNKGKELLDILTSEGGEEKYERLDSLLQNDIDLNYAAKFVVGKYWRQMSEEQQKRYLELFDGYAKTVYRSYSLNLRKGDIDFSVEKALADKKGVDVYCVVIINALEKKVNDESKGGVKVIFSLVKNDGKVKVRDMKIEELSFLNSYRERFYKMIHEDNEDEIEWFLESLEEIVRDNDEKNDY